VRFHIDNLVVVGVGLIGASCALALKAAGVVERVVGVGRGRSNLDAALRRGAIDVALTLDDDWTSALATADVVLVAAPVAQYPALFANVARGIGPQTIVTDAGSTKQDVVKAARASFGASLARFVPAHPIAGSERSGAQAADASLFRNRAVIVTPIAETASDAVARVAALWETCGARVTTMTAPDHDRVLAAVSHLPHLLAFVLVGELAARTDSAELFGRAGSGFRDFTRIAASSAEMWRDVTLANRNALLAELDRYRDALDDVRQLLASSDGARLADLFERAAAARRRLDDASE
jgi:prephenate dehydrogenase